MADRRRRSSGRRRGHDRLERNDPVQRDAELRAAGVGERCRLPGPADPDAAGDDGTMEPLIRTIPAWDGLPLCVRVWDGGDRLLPVLCLPGLVRTGGDFHAVVTVFASERRVVALDYAGRGGSGRSAYITRYGPEACLRDVLDVCAALHLHRVAIIGTSFGGLLAMGLAVARPALVRSVVLNDVGPDIGGAG